VRQAIGTVSMTPRCVKNSLGKSLDVRQPVELNVFLQQLEVYGQRLKSGYASVCLRTLRRAKCSSRCGHDVDQVMPRFTVAVTAEAPPVPRYRRQNFEIGSNQSTSGTLGAPWQTYTCDSPGGTRLRRLWASVATCEGLSGRPMMARRHEWHPSQQARYDASNHDYLL